jgi:peptidyl-prolyl cis-trans isomerase C
MGIIDRGGRCVAAALVCVGWLAGCSPLSDESPTLVIVNGKPITQSEFDSRWTELPPAARERYLRGGGKRRFLDDLVDRELLLQEARRQGLDQTPGARERLERAREQLALDELMRTMVKTQVEIPKEEWLAYYAKHEAELPGAERVRAAHIVVSSALVAHDLKRQLDKGAEFVRLAQRYSTDAATKDRGGELDLSRRDELPPAVDAAVNALRPGSVSQPIEAKDGFHLVKVIVREPGDDAARHAALERLRQELYAEKQRTRFEALLAGLRGRAAIRLAEGSRMMMDDPGAR